MFQVQLSFVVNLSNVFLVQFPNFFLSFSLLFQWLQLLLVHYYYYYYYYYYYTSRRWIRSNLGMATPLKQKTVLAVLMQFSSSPPLLSSFLANVICSPYEPNFNISRFLNVRNIKKGNLVFRSRVTGNAKEVTSKRIHYIIISSLPLPPLTQPIPLLAQMRARRLKVNQDEFVSALDLGARDDQSNIKTADVLQTFLFLNTKSRKIKKERSGKYNF